MFRNKKAVSPLLATLLLMGFAIALGTVVMSWGKSYIEDQAEFVGQPEFSGCSNVQLSLITVAGKVQACYQDTHLEIMLENGPEVAIQNFNVQVIGTEGVQTIEGILKEPLKRTHALKKTIPYSGIGKPLQVKLTPLINVNNVELYCSETSLIIEDALHSCV
ncbi:hypothetical protein J4410_03250 [Candidatus Woesearchaeota archaeon]|nr:hypothetical protein [Candidatus Woesearchaeota archaeon]